MFTIIVLAKEWGFTNGGINVFNKLMCEALADVAGDKGRIICCASNISRNEIKSASKDHGLYLYSFSPSDFCSPDTIVSTIREHMDVNGDLYWIGHDSYTDKLAVECRDLINGSKCALIHHMAYGTYYPLLNKDTKKTQEKEMHQKECFKKADYVFANGPLLCKNAQDLCKNNDKVTKIYPGVAEVDTSEYVNKIFNVVSFGRVEKENGSKRNNTIIKQIYLAVAAWADFTYKHLNSHNESTMKVYGTSDSDSQDDLNGILSKYAGKLYSLAVVDYIEDRKNLLSELADASLCLILSAKEGFGMTALEAISAGVPIIVSKSSGFYQALDENYLAGYVCGVEIQAKLEEPYFTQQDLDIVSKAIYEVYDNIERYKEKALCLKEKLKECGFTWNSCAQTILEKLTGTLYSTVLSEDDGICVREILNAFNRPVFTTRFSFENDLIEFSDALKDTISIINTGKNNKGSKINKYSVKDIKDLQTRIDISEIVNGINTLRTVFTEGKKKKLVKTSGCVLVTRDQAFGELMDELRLEILWFAKKLADKYSIDFPHFIILDEMIWHKICRESIDRLEDMMMKSCEYYRWKARDLRMFD